MRIVFILSAFLAASYPVARAAESTGSNENQTMVFDPQTKKYFVGGGSKFILKPSTQTGLVESIQVSLDGGEFQTYNGGIQFSTEGKHSLKFRAKDPVNNWAPVQMMEVFVDMTPPTTEPTFEDGKFMREGGGQESAVHVQQGSRVKFAATDNLSGVASIQFSWNGSTFNAYQDGIKLEKQGRQTLYFKSSDRVGNSEVVKKIELVCDGTMPNSSLSQSGIVRPIKIGDKSYLAASDSVSFSIKASDDLSQVKHTWVSVDGAPEKEYKEPVYFLTEGAHSLKYFAEDGVGNKEEPKVVSIFTISHPATTTAVPVGKLINMGGMNFATKKFQLELHAKENAAGLERIEFKVTGDADFRSYLEPIQFNKTGDFSVAYRAVDRAGNVESTRVFNVTILDTPPETKIATAHPLIVRDGITYSASPNIITLSVDNSEVGVAKTQISINEKPFTDYTGPVSLTADSKVYKISFKSIDRLGNEEQKKTVTYHMLNAVPTVNLFVETGVNRSEEVPTSFVDQHPKSADGGTRDAASIKKPAPKKK